MERISAMNIFEVLLIVAVMLVIIGFIVSKWLKYMRSRYPAKHDTSQFLDDLGVWKDLDDKIKKDK
jgi:hypothetical protein